MRNIRWKSIQSIFILAAAITLLVGCGPQEEAQVENVPTDTEEQNIVEETDVETQPIESYFTQQEITEGDEVYQRIYGKSFPTEGEVALSDLRYLKMLYVDYDGNTCSGEMIVNAEIADATLEIFYQLYEAKYPLASVKLVDDYGEVADDHLSMAANNTSAFCYRQVTGSQKLSWHSFGAAIDINPVQNPYINGSRVSPPEGRNYLNRKEKGPHMIDHSDFCYKVFKAHGWKWGGDFSGDKDYQHFYKELSGVKR